MSEAVFPGSEAGRELADKLDSILPPEGIVATRLRDVAAHVRKMERGRADVSGLKGSAGAAVTATLAKDSAPNARVVVVTGDLDSARRMADDMGFFLRGALDEAEAEDSASGDVLVLSVAESSPYADVNPDRRAAMSRMATLSHLAHLPWRVLVVPASALVRKVVPRSVFEKNTARIVAEQELDREALLKQLSEGGYLRVPVVEDPGSFAVRGALLDVWPPSSEMPVRIELYGDLVLSMKTFDAHEQRTKRADGTEELLTELWLPPAREVILTKETLALAKDRVQQLAEMIDWPTTRTRTLIEDVMNGRAFFGADGFLPAYFPELETIFSYIDETATFVLDDPAAITAAVREELERG
ncbi:MAG: transcription-repair coupling factor, partial [Polyangiaceae bacterium]